MEKRGLHTSRVIPAVTRGEERFRVAVRKFVADEIEPIAERIEREEYFPRDIIARMGRKHLLGAPFPKSDGGLGLGWVSEAVAAEEVSAASAATEMARLASATLYSAPLSAFGTVEQRKQYLRPVLSGQKLGALALTEPDAGSDAASIRTRARRDGTDFLLEGEKRFITNGSVADFLFVFAVTDPRKPPRSRISAFIVPKANGVKVVKDFRLLGMHGSRVTHLRFQRVRVPKENVVGGLHRGFGILLDELDKERPAVAAGMMGIARSAMEAAIRYSAKRQQFGRKIREFQGISFKIADMATKLEASRLLVLQATRLIDQGESARKAGAIAKLFATETAFQVCHDAVQVHGGIGYTKETPVERYFRDARFMMIGGGTSEIMRHIIQRAVFREAGF